MTDSQVASVAADIAAGGVPPAPTTPHDDYLERARAAERRLEGLVRLAAEIVPPAGATLRESQRTPSAWRAFVRELNRARRHLARCRGEYDSLA